MRYIGSKVKLLDNIESVIIENTKNAKLFCDIFSGTSAVAKHFKNKFEIISNDFLYFSYVIQRATIKNNSIPPFNKLYESLKFDVFDFLNSIDENESLVFDESKFLIRNNYSSYCGRNYLSEQNARIVDKWRLTINQWFNEKLISEDEYYYLVACVVETIPYYSNISGTYGAFLKTWDKRALKKIELVKIDVENNNRNNKCYNEDSDSLINHIHGDILYIDPPYNERQYLPNYHLLETIARYDYPEISGVTGVRKYNNQKSKWCLKKEVTSVFENMIKNANFKYIILSYNTDGIMKETDIVSIMEKYAKKGTIKTYRISYSRFKSRTLTNTSELNELIFFMEKELPSKKELQKKDIIKSPFNYIGGKTKILNQLSSFFPSNISTFIEPFCGGYNVGINLDFNKGLAIDVNCYLIELIQFFKNSNLDNIINEIKFIIASYKLDLLNVDGYNRLRDDYNKYKKPLLLFVLLCFSFNHQIRFNNSGKFNTPFGKERSCYNQSIENNLIKFVNKLQKQNVEFVSGDFSNFNLDELDNNSFVYCDPPYYISNGSYNDGTRCFGDWTEDKDKELMDLLDRLNNKKIKFALSNVFYHKGVSNDPLIQWSKKYNIHFIDSNYNNSNYQSGAKEHKTIEVLITNY